MKRFLQSLSGPETWIQFFTLLATAGLGCMVLGEVIGSAVLQSAGFWLSVPLLASGLLLLGLLGPLLLVQRFLSHSAEYATGLNPDGVHPAQPILDLVDEVAVALLRTFARFQRLPRSERAASPLRRELGGFDPAVITTGLGLTSIRERAELVSGTVRVESRPGVGTTIAVEVPL